MDENKSNRWWYYIIAAICVATVTTSTLVIYRSQKRIRKDIGAVKRDVNQLTHIVTARTNAVPNPAPVQKPKIEAAKSAAKKVSDKLNKPLFLYELKKIVPDYQKLSTAAIAKKITAYLGTNIKTGIAKGTNKYEIAENLLKAKIGACGGRSVTMMVLFEALGRKGRLVNLCNIPKPGSGHTVFELFYDNAWHLFDPTYGAYYTDEKGRVFSFGELRKNPKLIESKGRVVLGKIDSDLSGFFVSADAYNLANPAGEITANNRFEYPVYINMGMIYSDGTVWSVGKRDKSSDDMQKLNQKPPIPAGLYYIGRAMIYSTHNFKLHNMLIGETYTLNYYLVDVTGLVPLNLESQGIRIIEASRNYAFAPGKKIMHITFTATNTDGYIHLNHIASQGCYALVDRLEITRPAKLSTAPLFKQTPILGNEINENGVLVCRIAGDEKLYFSVFGVAIQALNGTRILPSLSIKPEKVQWEKMPTVKEDFGDPMKGIAFKWLFDNAKPLKNGALTWHYEFDNAYNDIYTKKPWPSAFGQAYVIKAFIHGYNETKAERYKEFATKACLAYEVSIKDGGFRSVFPDGSFFYEEMPNIPAPHILNGHMISTLTLIEAGRELKNKRIEELGLQGLATLKKHLDKYDLGYWVRYDLNPRKEGILFQLKYGENDSEDCMKIDSISLSEDTSNHSIALDLGAPNDAKGSCKISGIDWKQVEIIDRRTVRGFFDGVKRRKPDNLGLQQFSLFFMNLPRKKFEDYSLVPDYWLKIEYYDAAVGSVLLRLRDISHSGVYGWVGLQNGIIKCLGDKKWKTVYIPIQGKNFAWYVGPAYQQYHTKLARLIADITKDDFFARYARRWQAQLDANEENVKKKNN